MLAVELEIFFVFLFLVMHAFFSLAEMSVLNVRKSRLREIIADEESDPKTVRRARIVLGFKLGPESFLATVQSGSVFAAFLAATYTTFIAYDHLWVLISNSFGLTQKPSEILAFLIVIILATLLDLTFGALIPKSIAIHHSERIALFLADTIRVLTTALKPITSLPVGISNIILRPFRDKTSFVESRMSEEEFRVMLEEGARTGVIDKTENELIENIFEFRERTAREVMVPRIKMRGIDIATPREKVIQTIIDEGYTRIPVYEDSIENIIGVIYSKDVVALIEHPELILLYDIVRMVPFVPETKLISEMLREFQRSKLHMAIVIDEFGGTAGLVTLEDIVEEIVGEIHDEYDEDDHHATLDEVKHSITLSASLAISDANDELEKYFPEFRIPDDEEYESVSGYVNKLFGYIPDLRESIAAQGVLITVTKKAPTSVLEVEFEPVQDDRKHSNGENL